jgi:hypothetical protein
MTRYNALRTLARVTYNALSLEDILTEQKEILEDMEWFLDYLRNHHGRYHGYRD